MDYFKMILDQMSSIWHSLCVSCLMKSLIALSFGTATYLFGATNTNIVVSLFVLIAIDLITGITAAIKNDEVLSSPKLFKTATKAFVYCLFLSAGHFTGVIVPIANFVFAAIAAFLALTELLSVMENIAKMGYSVPQKLLNIKFPDAGSQPNTGTFGTE